MHSRTSNSPSRSPDPLSHLVALLRPQAIYSKLITGTGSWGVSYTRQEHSGFCVLLRGSCVIRIDGRPALRLHRGDFLLMPQTLPFTLASDLKVEPRPITPTPSRDLHHGKRTGPATMVMLGGYFRFDDANAKLLVRLLPAMLLIRRGQAGAARLRTIVELLGEETAVELPGSELMLERLVDMLLIEALRVSPATEELRERGLLAGLGHAGLSRALRTMHDDIARGWTVAQLARVAGMSRAAFADHFTRTLQMTPMQYLLQWRVALAKDILRREGMSLAQVAQRVGYSTASAFSTAFTRACGVSPSEFRHAAQNRASAPTVVSPRRVVRRSRK
jgi:AraC-like DNA-binding protein